MQLQILILTIVSDMYFDQDGALESKLHILQLE